MSNDRHRSNFSISLVYKRKISSLFQNCNFAVFRSRRASGLGGYDDADDWKEDKQVGAHLDDPHPQTQQYDEGKKY